jgi:hypothetical protein
MLDSKTDYFFVIIFFIVVAAFLGISIVNIIDKKLSNISINVPKIKLPPSEVTVNFEKSGSSYKVKCSKKEIKKSYSRDSDVLEQESSATQYEVLDNDKNINDKKINNQDYDEDPELNKEVIIHDIPKKIINKDIEISYADYESEIEDENLEVGKTIEIRENMTGLTAEQFFNKHYVNPYKPVKNKRKKQIKHFEAFNNVDYQ